MAFDLRTNNLTGVSVLTDTLGLLATQENFTTLYDYANVNSPELEKELFYANGKGSITGFLKAVGQKKMYAADTVQHKEIGRLHQTLTNVAVAGNVFTSPTPHNLRVGDVVKITDNIVERQAQVTAIGSTTVFTALNGAVGAYGFTGNVTVLADYSSNFAKGSDPFLKGKTRGTKDYINYSQIIKETYDCSESFITQNSWVMTPAGPRWFNLELERTGVLFDNKAEQTIIFNKRNADSSPATLAGLPQGMKGIVEQVEQYGNISNDYISTIADLYKLALRIKQQTTCREYVVYADHNQMTLFQTICGSVNASFLNGTNFGTFSNNKDMAIMLDFASIFVSGITFHFTAWNLLDDPTFMGATQYANTGISFLMMPSGNCDVTEDGNTVKRPYVSVYYRGTEQISRERQVKIFGLNGTPQKSDTMTANFLTEATNKVVGANAFFVGRRGASFYS